MPLELAGFALEAGALLKIPAIITALFYIVFAFVIIKQVSRMTDTLAFGFEGVLRAISFIHLLFSIGALLAVLIFL